MLPMKLFPASSSDLTLTIKTHTRVELIDITGQVQKAITDQGIDSGLCMVYVPHTTAAMTINESADPDVAKDIVMALNRLVPADLPFRHGEGNSDAHVKSSLVGASELVAVKGGRLVLGTWQGLFFCEFDGPRTRRCHISLLTGGHPVDK
jgi:secondary thiamine-phosphate synthase enzyme